MYESQKFQKETPVETEELTQKISLDETIASAKQKWNTYYVSTVHQNVPN